MVVRLTASCNNRCFFCLVEDEISRREFRSLDEIVREIDQVPPDEDIDIFGGEPTIDPIFWEVVAHALSTGRWVTLATNVRLFAHRPSAERLWALGGGRLLVRTSLMGHTAELHDHLNVRKGAFRQTVQGIRNLSELGFDVQTNIVILTENVDHLLATALVAIEAGSRKIKLSGTIRTGNFLQSVPSPRVVRDRIRALVPVLRALGVPVSLEKLSPCLAPENLDILGRDSTPAATQRTWYRKVDACRSCSLVSTCHGAERGALAHHGTTWVEPIPAVPPALVDEVSIAQLDAYHPRKDKPFVRVLFDQDDEQVPGGMVVSIAAFSARHPQLHLIA